MYPDGTSADNDDEVYPGADDICDGKDNDLNGDVMMILTFNKTLHRL